VRGRFFSLAAMLLAIALVGAACGDKNSVGSGVKLNKGGGGGALRDVVTTTSQQSSASTTRPVPTTRGNVTTTTQARKKVTLTFYDADNQPARCTSPCYMDPPAFFLKRGTDLEVVNSRKLAKMQIKVFPRGSQTPIFKGPVIDPGKSWVWDAPSWQTKLPLGEYEFKEDGPAGQSPGNTPRPGVESVVKVVA